VSIQALPLTTELSAVYGTDPMRPKWGGGGLAAIRGQGEDSRSIGARGSRV
jgi:hypothetical protein